MRTDQIKPTEKSSLKVSRDALPENLRSFRSSSVVSFQSLLQNELDKRNSEKDSNHDKIDDKYQTLISEFIENLVANSGRSFLILKNPGISDALQQIIFEMRKELGITMLHPLHNHIKEVSDFIDRKNSLYSNNQSKYRDPVGALYTGSV